MGQEPPTTVEPESAKPAVPWRRGVQRLAALFAVSIPLGGILFEIPLLDWSPPYSLDWRVSLTGILYYDLYGPPSDVLMFCAAWAVVPFVMLGLVKILFGLVWWLVAGFGLVSSRAPRMGILYPISGRVGAGLAAASALFISGAFAIALIDVQNHAHKVREFRTKVEASVQYIEAGEFDYGSVQLPFPPCVPEIAARLRSPSSLSAAPNRLCLSSQGENALQAERVRANAETLRDYLRPHGAATKECHILESALEDLRYNRFGFGWRNYLYPEADNEQFRNWKYDFAETLLHGAGIPLKTLLDVPPRVPECILCQSLVLSAENSGQCAISKELGATLLSESRKRGLPPITKILAQPAAQEVGAPFRVSTDPAGLHTYLKIEALDTEAVVFRAIVRAGESVTASLPLGRYQLKYAAGQEWLDEEQLFGGTTRFYQAEEIFDLKLDGTRFSGVAVDLRTRPGGNLRTNEINGASF